MGPLWASVPRQSVCTLETLGNQAAVSCCQLENEILRLQHDLYNVREGDQQSQRFLDLQKQRDAVNGRLTILQGIHALVQDFQNFRERIQNPSDLGAPLQSLLQEVREDSVLIQRLHAVHTALNELEENEQLRGASSPEELRQRLEERCIAIDSTMNGHTLCQALNIQTATYRPANLHLTRNFQNSEEFLGAFLEAYHFAHREEQDQDRLERVREYRRMLSDAANGPVVEQLMTADTAPSPLREAAEALEAPVTQGQEALTQCLANLRYSTGTRASGSECRAEYEVLEAEVIRRRQAMVDVLGADAVLRRLIPQSVADSERLATGRQRGVDQLSDLVGRLSYGGEENEGLRRQVDELNLKIREQVNTGLMGVQGPERLIAEHNQGERSAAARTQNLLEMNGYATSYLERFGCQSDETKFLSLGGERPGENSNLTVDVQKLHACLKEGQLTAYPFASEIQALEAQKARLEQSMNGMAQREDFRQGQSLLNFLAYRMSTQCSGRAQAEQVGTPCYSQDHGGMVQVYQLVRDGTTITRYYTDAREPQGRSNEEVFRMHNFCVRNRESYPDTCRQISQLYRERTEQEREVEAFREYFAETAVYTDTRTGEVRRVPRQSTGSMVANALAGTLVNNLGWGLQYWQTNQMLPIQHQMALNQKTMMFHQQQYIQHHMFNPTAFSGYMTNGFGQPRAPIQNIQTFSL